MYFHKYFPGALTLASASAAQKASYCPSGGVCYAVNIPASTASSGTGDIFFQITGPSSLSWIGLGQGSSMSGANIFIIYIDSTGTNVILSPRLGTGEKAPDVDTSARVTLLDGSGIWNNVMTANVKCSNCNSWSGGTMSFTDSASKWIWAYKSGPAIASDSVSASLSQHNSYGTTTFNLQTAAGGGDSTNPFMASAATVPKSGSSSGASRSSPSVTTTTCSTVRGSLTGPLTGRPTGQRGGGNPFSSPTVSCETIVLPGSSTSGQITGSQGTNGQNANGQGSSGGGAGGSFGPPLDIITSQMAHGILAGLAFVVFFPVGAISIRLLSFPGLVWFHATWMVCTYLAALTAMGLGIWLATSMKKLDAIHSIIGFVVVVALVAQPITGLLHHLLYKRHGRPNTATYPHIWWGRAVVTLGIINGGLGLQFADNSKSGEIAYGVVAGFMWLLWIIAIILVAIKSRRNLEGENGQSVFRWQNKKSIASSTGNIPQAMSMPYQYSIPSLEYFSRRRGSNARASTYNF